jgi:hypothetical protein
MKFLQFIFIFLLSVVFLSSCKKRGCADPDALNFDINASKDDHSCYYYWIGQHYGGGDIIYIDQTKKHGLITATFNLQKNHSASAGYIATSTDVYSGRSNTELIAKTFGPGTAAYDCYILDTLGYSDWFLPSKEEAVGLISLSKLGQANTNGIAYLLSSSYSDSNNIWTVYIPSSTAIPMDSGAKGAVRPMRTF